MVNHLQNLVFDNINKYIKKRKHRSAWIELTMTFDSKLKSFKKSGLNLMVSIEELLKL